MIILKLSEHSFKIKDSAGMQKIKNRNKKLLIEKNIYNVEFENPYSTTSKEKP